MSYYRTCPYCGAHLDSGERCDCIPSLYATLGPEDREAVDAMIHRLVKQKKNRPRRYQHRGRQRDHARPLINTKSTLILRGGGKEVKMKMPEKYANRPNLWRLACELSLVAQDARAAFPERFTGKSDKEIINEIAGVVRRAEGAGV